MISHFEFLGNSNIIGAVYTKYFHNATMAVDYFFMLSGFGICLSTKRPEKSWKSKMEYAISKINKIYPAYVVSLALMIPYTYMSSYTNVKLKLLIWLGIDLPLLQSITGMTLFSRKRYIIPRSVMLQFLT